MTTYRRRVRRAWILAMTFAVWTLFVWATRIFNILDDDAMDRPEKVGRVGLALTFSVLAVGLVAALMVPLIAKWDRSLHPVVVPIVTGLAGWTTGVWLLMSGVVYLEDYRSTGFKVVHWTLAAASIALGVVTTWAVNRVVDEDEGAEGSSDEVVTSSNGETPALPPTVSAPT
jgi:hypothetical protein